jgi:dihydrolipoamide dehydrogenase
MDKKWDLIIIGGGPGGYVAAIRGAQMKKKVLLVEEHKIGGTCMNYGCIPAKYLLHQTKIYKDLKTNRNLEGPLKDIKCNWKRVQEGKKKAVERLIKGLEFLLEKNGVEIVRGKGLLQGNTQVSVMTDGKDEQVFDAEKIILAAGSRPVDLPFLKPNGKEIMTSREALELADVPPRMIVIGAGAIGLELATIYHRLGSEVSILEILPTALPGCDLETVQRLERILKAQGLHVYTQMKIESSQIIRGKVLVKGTSLQSQSPFEFEAEKVLLAVGRSPNSERLSARDSGPAVDEKGWVRVNPQLESNIPGVYAIGDLIGGKLLAHKASHEGLLAAENAAGENKEMHYEALPMAVYTDPEFSSVGLTEEEAKEKGMKIQTGLFSLQANGRALTLERQEGMVKIIADESDLIIGAHVLAPNASEFISEITLAVSRGLKIQELSSSIHIHPTLSEAVMEAALKVKNEAIHILNV